MKPKPFIALKNLTVPLAFSPVSWRCGPPGRRRRRRRAATAALDRHRLAFDSQVGRRDPAAAIDERELERLAVGKVGETRLLDRGDVDEHVLAAVIANDEAEALLRVEEFDDALAFANDLRGHSAAAAAAAAEATAAAAAAAEATAAAAAEAAAATAADHRRRSRRVAEAAASAAAAAVAAALLESAAVIRRNCSSPKTVALVAAAPAAVPLAPSIETHAVQTSVCPH